MMTFKPGNFSYLIVVAIISCSCNDFLTKDVALGQKSDTVETTETESTSTTTSSSSSTDSDGDGLGDDVEALFGGDDGVADTDHDGIADGYEFISDTGDPLNSLISPIPESKSIFLLGNTADSFDSDLDGLGDNFENTNGLDANNPDTDGDGYNDVLELLAGSDPFVSTDRPVRSSSPVEDGITKIGNPPIDTDNDGLSDDLEALNGSSSTDADTDNDGFNDTIEYLSNSDASDVNSIPNLPVPTPPE